MKAKLSKNEPKASDLAAVFSLGVVSAWCKMVHTRYAGRRRNRPAADFEI